MSDVIELQQPKANGRATARRGDALLPEVLEARDGFLARVLEMLSHHERMALRLHHSDGLAPGAVAARMKLPESIARDLIASGERTIRAAQLAFLEALFEQAPRAAVR